MTKEERREYISDFSNSFQLNEMVLSLVENNEWQIDKIEIIN